MLKFLVPKTALPVTADGPSAPVAPSNPKPVPKEVSSSSSNVAKKAPVNKEDLSLYKAKLKQEAIEEAKRQQTARRLAEIRKEIAAAVGREDYAAAAELKKTLDSMAEVKPKQAAAAAEPKKASNEPVISAATSARKRAADDAPVSRKKKHASPPLREEPADDSVDEISDVDGDEGDDSPQATTGRAKRKCAPSLAELQSGEYDDFLDEEDDEAFGEESEDESVVSADLEESEEDEDEDEESSSDDEGNAAADEIARQRARRAKRKAERKEARMARGGGEGRWWLAPLPPSDAASADVTEAERPPKAEAEEASEKASEEAEAEAEADEEDDANAEDDEEDDEEAVYEVEEIRARRLVKGRNGEEGTEEFLVRWKGYTLDDDTWEPRENIFDEALLADFEKRHAAAEERRKALNQKPAKAKAKFIL